MGSVSLAIGDGTARFNKGSFCSSAVNVLMLFSVIATNLFAFYSFSYHPTTLQHNYHNPENLSLISEKVSAILREIGSSQQKLSQMEKKLLGYESIDLSRSNVAEELKVFLNHHQLPLGKDSRTGITEMVASVGHSCYKSVGLLSQFMSYKVNSVCPDDWSLGQKLILQGCEPLPRRRCFVKTIPKLGLHPFPASVWRNVSEKICSWSGLGCKNFACLSQKKLNRDCAGCFDIVEGYETQRYVKARSKNDFLIDDVLVMAKDGVRIGFDLGGGSGTFAARMAEKNVTVVTASLNIDAPFNEFIASRGLFPLYLSLDYRFPFYDHVFDLVHIGNGLDMGGQAEKLEFLMFDIDRVLRAGGLVWLDNFYCSNDDKRRVVSRLVELFGYKKLKWVVGEKFDGSRKPEIYLSTVLQKPARV
ncbi:probable methyltransferase At1g29790 [Primulina huaijiensis]|uniref:probable methyltransferase At1g29790 n=1 Tax=Primulina huaijiensis TaxID=1492673 RepID=UPI003CC78597